VIDHGIVIPILTKIQVTVFWLDMAVLYSEIHIKQTVIQKVSTKFLALLYTEGVPVVSTKFLALLYTEGVPVVSTKFLALLYTEGVPVVSTKFL